MNDRSQHWDSAYELGLDTRSWFQTEALPSLRMLDRLGLTGEHSLIDIGGGASPLVDALLLRGAGDIAVLDVSEVALGLARTRLADRAAEVEWLRADLLEWVPDRHWDFWHDRAVLHFLTDPADQRSYVQRLNGATRNGAIAVIATFAPDGPEMCSGLPVTRHDAASLGELFGEQWELVADETEWHDTPAGGRQHFTWVGMRRR